MSKSTKKELLTYLTIIVLIVIIRTFFVTPVRVNGSSMYPTLKNGEIMILNKIHYKFHDIKRSDIVVVKIPDDKIIKRVIGLPGDKIKVKDGVLYVNNKLVKEDYIKELTEDFDLNDLGYKKVPKNMYFVMGDNRNNSADSRIIGCVKKKQIMGKTKLVIFPFTKVGNRD